LQPLVIPETQTENVTMSRVGKTRFEADMIQFAKLGNALLRKGCCPNCQTCGQDIRDSIRVINAPDSNMFDRQTATSQIKLAAAQHARESLNIFSLGFTIEFAPVPSA
jgi:hypothetical protein